MDHQDQQPERLYIVPSAVRGPSRGFITSLPPERWHELQEQEERRMDEYDRQRYGDEFVEYSKAARRLREG